MLARAWMRRRCGAFCVCVCVGACAWVGERLGVGRAWRKEGRADCFYLCGACGRKEGRADCFYLCGARGRGARLVDEAEAHGIEEHVLEVARRPGVRVRHREADVPHLHEPGGVSAMLLRMVAPPGLRGSALPSSGRQGSARPTAWPPPSGRPGPVCAEVNRVGQHDVAIEMATGEVQPPGAEAMLD